MTSTPSTAPAVSTDLADRLLTEAFVIIDISLSVGPGSRQLTWEALDINPDQLVTLKSTMGAKPPCVTPFEALKKAGSKVKSAIESFQDAWTVKSEPFRLYPRSNEEKVAERLYSILALADEQRAAVIDQAPAARAAWHEQVDLLLQQANTNDPEIAATIRSFFPSDERLQSCLSVYWTLKVVGSLEEQAEQSVQLREVLAERHELTAREQLRERERRLSEDEVAARERLHRDEVAARKRLHRDAERLVRQATQKAADAAADDAHKALAQLLADLQQGVNDKTMNGQRRKRMLHLTERLEHLAQCFSGSDGLVDIAENIREFTGGVARTHKQGSAEFQQRLEELRAVIEPEITSLTDPTKRGHRSVARFIQ